MTEPTSMPPPAEVSVEAKNPKSKGEKFFDRFVYGGIAGVGTFLVTLGVALSIKYGRGKSAYAKAVDWMSGKMSGIMPGVAGRKFSEEFVQTTTLMQGGNVMLLPVGIAEHYKVPIVSGLNTMFGDPTSPEKIEDAPKQTWWSLIEGRALAWTAVFTTLFGASLVFPKSFQTFTSEFGEQMHKLVGKFKALRSSPVMKETRAYKIGELAALDVFATAAAATLLYVGGHFFARKHEEKLERKAAQTVGRTPLLRNEAEELRLVLDTAQPTSLISGDKYAAGTVQAPALAQQLAQ